MAEKKTGIIRRTPPLDIEDKQQDQPLRNAEDVPKIGKIQGAMPKSSAKQPTAPTKTAAGEKAGSRKTGTGRRPAAQKKQEGQPARGRNSGAGRKPAEGTAQAQPKRKQPAAKRSPAAQQGTAAKAAAKPQGKGTGGTAKAAGTGKTTGKPATPRSTTGRRGRPPKRGSTPSIKAYFLGGLNEIGKNFTLFECGDDMMIIDCGMAFPDDDMLGIDIVIPDFTFLEKNIGKIRGVVITHGHEDHIGSVPYLLRRFKLPIYGTAMTIGLIQNKLREHNLLSSANLNVVTAGSRIRFGCMEAELIRVNHSIADAVAIAIHSPAGILVHTGDFKIDFTPTGGERIDLNRFAELGNEGVLALFADSTNAERPGFTQTEQMVNNSLDNLFKKAEDKRIIIASFASNTSRVQQIINCAVKYGRKVALSGRSMLNVIGIAQELGYMHIPDGVLIELNMINRYRNEEIVLITTGSQGEPMSALTRMAFSDHRQVELSENDFIIISARPIPGNEKTVGHVVDELLRKNCTVIYESMYEVHVSGHACQEELKLIQVLCKPKYFIPVHGEHKHLRKHAALAVSLGMPEENIFIGSIGNSLELNQDFMRQGPDVPAGDVMVDGLGVGDIGSIVLRDRKHLAEDGIIIAVCTLHAATGRVASGPDIVSRGFVYVRESEKLMDEARKLVYNTLEACTKDGLKDWTALKQNVKDALSKFLYRKTRRSPMVLPIIMEV